MGERIGVYTVLVGKPEGKRSLGRPSRRWIFRRYDLGVWTRSMWLRIWTTAHLTAQSSVLHLLIIGVYILRVVDSSQGYTL